MHLERAALKIVAEWFPNNFMKLKEDKYHLMKTRVKESKEHNLLCMTLDQSLSFKTHFKTFCKKVSQIPMFLPYILLHRL